MLWKFKKKCVFHSINRITMFFGNNRRSINFWLIVMSDNISMTYCGMLKLNLFLTENTDKQLNVVCSLLKCVDFCWIIIIIIIIFNFPWIVLYPYLLFHQFFFIHLLTENQISFHIFIQLIFLSPLYFCYQIVIWGNNTDWLYCITAFTNFTL